MATAKAYTDEEMSDEAPFTPHNGQRILLAEDNDDLRDLISAILAEAGYGVETCQDGREALACLRANPADVVVLDLRMPVMDGWEFRTAQRADQSIANVPVVVMTSDRSPQATAIHADAYIQKPFQPHELLSEIERVFVERARQERASRREETERLALLGTVAAGVGHEINNPLAFAMGNLELIEEALPALRDELAALLASSAVPCREQVLAGMMPRIDHVQSLLKDSRMGMERVRLIVRNLRNLSPRHGDRRQLINLNELVESSISMAWSQIRYRAMLVRSFGELPQTMGNEGRLGQVFMNLLVNAAQSMPPDRADSNQINVTTRSEEAWSVVEIRDTGPGMTKVLQARIFDAFFTTKATEGGTGLGLSICRDIVEAHGGRIEVESELGQGSVFRVYLPSQSLEQQRHAAEAGLALPTTSVGMPRVEPSSRPVVWVLDDEPMVADIIARIVRNSCDVLIAEGAEDVFARLEAGETFDAFCCDLMMLAVTGMEIRARISARWPHLLPRMVFISGGPSTPEGIEFVSQPDRLILDKPFDAERLRSTLDRVFKENGLQSRSMSSVQAP